MSYIKNRLGRLEEAIRPVASLRYERAIMDYDEQGKCAELTIRGQRFTPLAGQTEDDLCARAAKESGTTDELMLVQLVHAGPNGGLAPGFERFGKRT